MNNYNLIINETLMSSGDCTLKLQGKATEMAKAAESLASALLATGLGYRNDGTTQDENEEFITISVTRRRKDGQTIK